MTEIPETHSNSTESPQTNDRVGEVINELRRHLTIPSDDRSPDWQSSVGHLISAICSDFAKREEDEIALTEIALVSYAAQKGSKEAKKRALKPIRWATITPTC